MGITFPLRDSHMTIITITRLEVHCSGRVSEISLFPQETWEEEDKVASAAAEEEPAVAVEWCQHVNMF